LSRTAAASPFLACSVVPQLNFCLETQREKQKFQRHHLSLFRWEYLNPGIGSTFKHYWLRSGSKTLQNECHRPFHGFRTKIPVLRNLVAKTCKKFDLERVRFRAQKCWSYSWEVHTLGRYILLSFSVEWSEKQCEYHRDRGLKRKVLVPIERI
jgi:hypothetical protein